MTKKTEGRGLGRTFYDIMGDNVLDAKSGAGETLRISDIEPRRDQPRKTFEREALQTLADSIAVYGVLQPIIVRENADFEGTYEIIAGERRWRAAKMAGLSEIPAVVFDGDELKAAQVALIENIQREDLNPVEEAMGYGALIDRFGLTQEQVAKQVGKSRPAVANMLRLLDLPDEVLVLLRDGQISAGHAKALLALENQEDMIEIANRIIMLFFLGFKRFDHRFDFGSLFFRLYFLDGFFQINLPCCEVFRFQCVQRLAFVVDLLFQ